MIEDLGRHKCTKFTREEMVVDKALRSPFFGNSEEICEAYEIKKCDRTTIYTYILLYLISFNSLIFLFFTLNKSIYNFLSIYLWNLIIKKFKTDLMKFLCFFSYKILS